MRISRWIRLASLLVAVTPNFAWAQADRGSPPVKRALFIGINDYQNVPDLRGANNDVDLISSILVQRYGYLPENITRVHDRDATREGILAALRNLVESSGPNDSLYIHYSGHGSQVPDGNGDEPADGFDETLVPHDGRSPSIADITDDELAEILESLPAANVVVVLDSCHSGTATRGDLAVVSRWVPPDSRASLYQTPVQTRKVVEVLGERHTLITASASDQLALDGPVDGRPHGLFSYSLGRALSTSDTDVTAREAINSIESELERLKAQLGLRNMPEPQLEAPPHRLDEPLMQSPSEVVENIEEPRLPWVRVQAKSARAELKGAVPLGGLPGAIWAIYPPGETEFPLGSALAEVEIDRIEGDDAFGPIEPGAATIAADSRAVAVAPPPAPDVVPVRWSPDNPELGADVRAQLTKRLPSIKFVGPGEFARFVVLVEASHYRVLAADGASFVAEFDNNNTSEITSGLATLFSRSMSATELLSIQNPATEIDLRFGPVSRPPGENLVKRGFRLVPSGATTTTFKTHAPVYEFRKKGSARTHSNSLQVAVKTSHDCFLTIVGVDSQGKIDTLFPNALSETRLFLPNGKIEANALHLIPDSLSDGNKSGFHVDFGPPAGTDTLRAFCNINEASANALRASIGALTTGAIGEESNRDGRRFVRKTLVDSLRAGLARLTSRGLVLVADEANMAQTEVSQSPQVEPTHVEDAPENPTDVASESSEASAPEVTDWATASITLQVEER